MKNPTKNWVVAAVLAVGIVTTIVYVARAGKSGGSSPPRVDAMAGHHGATLATSATVKLADLVGKPAPDFSLNDRNGAPYTKDEFRGKKVVLFFNEGLMCYPACWNQIVALSADPRLNTEDTVALSVVVDPPAGWEDAVRQMPALVDARVAFDTGAATSAAFGTLTTPSSMHYGQLPGHTYVVMDPDGVVRHVFDDPNMGIHNDALAEELAKL
jgi:peroxiredoxin Q/BCP